jgi:hypothetical protein
MADKGVAGVPGWNKPTISFGTLRLKPEMTEAPQAVQHFFEQLHDAEEVTFPQ